jgi:hypothetical protein
VRTRRLARSGGSMARRLLGGVRSLTLSTALVRLHMRFLTGLPPELKSTNLAAVRRFASVCACSRIALKKLVDRDDPHTHYAERVQTSQRKDRESEEEETGLIFQGIATRTGVRDVIRLFGERSIAPGVWTTDEHHSLNALRNRRRGIGTARHDRPLIATFSCSAQRHL